jgi:hypothetical protein
MCTWITERAKIMGSGKGAQGWFSVTSATVYFDHPYHAPFDHALSINFINEEMGPSARVAVELSAESARELVRAIQAALDAGETQHILMGELRVPVGV